jgi:autotransporter-associated beta strand protein
MKKLAVIFSVGLSAASAWANVIPGVFNRVRLCLFLLVITPGVLQAQTSTNVYTGSSTNSWTNAANWSLGIVPDANTAVVISNGALVRDTGPSGAAYSVVLGGASGTTNTLFFRTAGHALTVETDLTMSPGAGASMLTLQRSNLTLTLGGGSGSILRGPGSGLASITIGGGFDGSLGLSSATVDALNTAQAGNATLTITNGQTYNILDIVRFNNNGNTGTVAVLNVAGGVFNVGGDSPTGTSRGNLLLNNGNSVSNTSTINLSEGGTIRATLIRRLNAGVSAEINWEDGTIANRSGGDLTLDAGAGAGVLDIFLAGTGTHTFEADADRTITVQWSAVLADKSGENGTLTKAGEGTLVLEGTNSYTGATTISAGSLVLGAAGSIGSSSVLDVASGATLNVSAVTDGFVVGTNQTLRGGGTVLGNTTVNGALQPGNSAGLLTFSNNLTLGSTAATTMEITGTDDRGTAFDAIDVGGLLTYGGALTLSLGTTFVEGSYSFDLFNFFSTSATNSFDSVDLGGLYSGSLINNGFGVWGLTSGVDTWTFTESSGLLALEVVPEPSTYALLVLASVGLGAHVVRRRRRAGRAERGEKTRKTKKT